MENLIECGLGVGWRAKYAQVNPNVTSDNTAATAQATHSQRNPRDVSICSGAPGKAAASNCDSSRGPDGVDKASSAKQRSLADWKRCSGFFSKQRRTILSKAGLIFAFISLSSGGISFKIAFITSIADSPPKVRPPLS